MNNGKLLALTAKYFLPLLLFFSLVVFFRGHDQPGGGFIGGLIGAVACTLFLFGYGSDKAKSLLPFDPRSLIGLGLLLSLGSALWGSYHNQGFFKSFWYEVALPGLEPFSVGTPQFFDLGVYLVVLGSLMIILLSMWEE